MPITSPLSVGVRFFQPLVDLWPSLTSSRACPQLSDLDFIQLGVSRVLSQAKSGRDFLQSHADLGGRSLAVSLFFETLKSKRREAVCQAANSLLCAEVARRCANPFAAFPELAEYDLYAGDGHYIKSAAHDERIGGDKQPVGNFYIFNLRSRALQHFELGLSDAGTPRKREHDMHAIKRAGMAALRLGAKKGRKVMIVWDRAGIDFRHWHKAKENGVYFLSREKENMRLEIVGLNPFDRSKACNEGVLRDELVSTSKGVFVRRIIYHDCVGDQAYSYLTSNLKLAPGMLVLLYKRRWDIEKAFDETENRFEEDKAWASSAAAKCIQSQMICMAYNLCLLMEELLEGVEQITNKPERERRAARRSLLIADLEQNNLKLPFVYWAIERLTQRGVKLIRWIRNHLIGERAWEPALAMLKRSYARQ